MLKESFRAWYRGTDRSKAEERLASLEKTIPNDSLPEFKELGDRVDGKPHQTVTNEGSVMIVDISGKDADTF